MGQVFAFNIAHSFPEIKDSFSKALKSAKGQLGTAKNVAETVKAKFEEAGGSTAGLKEGNANDRSLLNKTITDLTKEKTPEAQKTKETAFKTELQDISPESLERRETARKEYAEKIAKEPVKEYTNKPKMTKLEEKLFDQQKGTQKEISGLQEEISRYQSTLDNTRDSKGGSKSKKVTENKKILENIIEEKKANLQKAQDNLARINENIKAAAPKRKKLTQEDRVKAVLDFERNLKNHMEELQEISDNPKGEKAKEWGERFKKDQKYIEITKENMKRGKLPDPEFFGKNVDMLNKYYNEYQALDKLVNERLKTATGKEKLSLQRLKKNIETNSKINRAKKSLFDRYRTVNEAVKKPFIAKQLQDMGVNLGRHERVIFEAKKVLGQTEAKAKQAWENYKESPTTENLNKAVEQSGMDKGKVTAATENIEEGLNATTDKESETKFKAAENDLKGQSEGKEGQSKGKEGQSKGKEFTLSVPAILEGILKKNGINLSKNWIRNLMLASGGTAASITTLRGALRWARKQYKVQTIRSMQKSKNYAGIQKMYNSHIKGGGTQASWNKWVREAKK